MTKSMGGRRDRPAPFTAYRGHSGASGSRALPLADGVQLVGRIDLLSRGDRKDRSRVLMSVGASPAARMALLSANRADAWCVGVAAHISRLATTWLHPLASLDDQVDQIEDCEAEIVVKNTDAFLLRGGELAARAAGVRHVFTLGGAEYGVDLLSAVETVGSAAAKDLAGPDDVAALSYTGGTTGKSKGALRRHRELSGFAGAVLANFEIPTNPQFLAVAPISHCR